MPDVLHMRAQDGWIGHDHSASGHDCRCAPRILLCVDPASADPDSMVIAIVHRPIAKDELEVGR